MKKNPYIKITHVSPKVHEEIKNIADNVGVSVSSFLKPKLREIADSYPEKMRKPPLDY